MRKYRRGRGKINREPLSRREQGRLAHLKEAEGVEVPLDVLKAQLDLLREYLDTDLKPHEIHLMSERLAAFELSGLEPSEAKKLAERDRAKPALMQYGSMNCPTCGTFFAATKNMAEKHPFCWSCGQRIKVQEKVKLM